MLEQLLTQLKQGETIRLPDLARQFNVSEALVEQMLAELVRLGYLRLLDTCNPAACTACPQSAACPSTRPAHIWETTRKLTR